MNEGNYGKMIENVMFGFLDQVISQDLGDYNFPPTNIYKENESGSMVFEFAVAGYDPGEISIKFAGDRLEVICEPEDCPNDPDLEYFKSRIAKRSFHLEYSLLAGHFNTVKASATHKNGILKILIPSSEYVKPRDVEIKIN